MVQYDQDAILGGMFMKKILACLSVVVLLLSLLSIMVMAGGEEANTPEMTATTVTRTTAQTEEPPTGLFKTSLLPSDAADFHRVVGNGGSVTVSVHEDGYRFASTTGWPWAWYSVDDVEDMLCVDPASAMLTYDIEVVSGAAKVMLFFAGQSPDNEAVRGTFATINGLEYPSSVDPSTGDSLIDLSVGRYTDTVEVSELGYHEGLLDACGVMYFSGIKVFAVAGEVIIHDLSVSYIPPADVPVTTRTTMTLPNTRIVTAQSLMPVTMSKFARAEGNGGTVAIMPHGNGYRFAADAGWPSAWYECWFDSGMITVTDIENTYLRYDFEVVSGASKVMVYFDGQSPQWQASKGTYVTLNGLEHPEWVDPSTGDSWYDLPVGTYTAMVPISELGYSNDLRGSNGEMRFSGMKVFAVDGETIIYDLSIVTVEETASEGDIDNNGIVNMRDALMIYQYASGKNKSLTAEQLNTADIDKNGTVNMRDALALFRIASGK